MKFFKLRGEDTTTYGKEWSQEDFGPRNESEQSSED